MFRFREVERKIDRENVTNKFNEEKKEEGFKQIKPETDMTFEEAKDFLNSLFA